jgi:hypothetical protein
MSSSKQINSFELCDICNNNRSIKKLDFMTQKCCKSCFCRIVEKRIRKNIRVNKLFKSNDSVFVYDNSSVNSKIIIYIMNMLKEKMPFVLTIKKEISSKDLNENHKIILPINSDDCSDDFLTKLFSSKFSLNDYFKNCFEINSTTDLLNNKIVLILDVLSEIECFYFAKYKNLIDSNFKLKKHILDLFDNVYPETKHSIKKSINLIEKILE